MVVTEIRWFSSTGIPFNAQVISSGESPLTMVQTADTDSPELTALSAISKGAILGGTANYIGRTILSIVLYDITFEDIMIVNDLDYLTRPDQKRPIERNV